MKRLLLALLFLCFYYSNVFAADVDRDHIYIQSEVLTHTALNASFDEIVTEVNDLSGANLASDIAITSSGTFTLTGALSNSNTFTLTGTSINFGNGGSDVITFNAGGGMVFTPAATWTFSAAQTVSGTWADLGTVTTADINGGTFDGIVGGTTPADGSFTTLSTTGKFTAGANEIEGSAFDINGGDMTGVTISGALTWSAAQDLNSQALTNINVDSGAIDGVTIGGAAAPTITNLGSVATTGTITLGGKLTGGANEIEGSAFDINGGTLDAITSLTVANDVDIGAHELKAETLESDITTGIAPFTIASTTVSTNLNADLLDGYSYNETEIKPLGAWAAATSGSSTQATTDGFLVGYVAAGGGSDMDVDIKTDSSNPPTTIRINIDNMDSFAGILSFVCPVKKDDYYLITLTQGSLTDYWIPSGE